MILPNERIANLSPPQAGEVRRIGRVTRLGHNERTVPLPDGLVSEILSAIPPEELTAIPELGWLYEKMSISLGVARDCMLLCHGADQGINSVFQAYVGDTDEVIYTSPTYHRYSHFCKIYGGRAIELGYDKNFHTDLDALMANIHDQTKLVILVNPNSLSGSSVNLKDLNDVVARAEKHDALVLIDEVYCEYSGVTALPLLDSYDNLVIARSFSKAFGVAGARVGTMVGAPEVIRQLSKLKPRSEISAVSARIVGYLIDHPQTTRDYVASVKDSRIRLAAELERLGFGTAPSESVSLLVRLPDGLERSRLAADLWTAGYEIGARLPAPYDRYVRVTVGPWEQMAEFVRVFSSLARRGPENTHPAPTRRG